MPEKSPEAYSFITYGWVFALAILGGVVSFMRKLQLGHTRVFNLVEFIGEIVTSAFAGFAGLVNEGFTFYDAYAAQADFAPAIVELFTLLDSPIGRGCFEGWCIMPADHFERIV